MPTPLVSIRADGLGRELKLHRGATFGEVSNVDLRPKMPEIPSFFQSQTGKVAASLILGGAEHFTRKASRGGARNSGGRESYGLSAAQVGNLIAATAHAVAIGLPFNRSVTIHWQAAGIALADMATATGRFIDLMTKAIVRHGHRTAWLFVHEAGVGKGGHVHLLAHVPPVLVPAMKRLQTGWLALITGRKYRQGVIHSKPVGGRLGLEIGNPDLHATNLNAALVYMLKGAYPAVASRFGITGVEPGGLVIGKRCGSSQNIGAKARRAVCVTLLPSPRTRIMGYDGTGK